MCLHFGKIVVFKFPEDPDKDFIKRVVGVAGDEIKIREKQVFVNGKPLNHDFGIERILARSAIAERKPP